MKYYFCDTSAIVKRYHEEKGTEYMPAKISCPKYFGKLLTVASAFQFNYRLKYYMGTNYSDRSSASLRILSKSILSSGNTSLIVSQISL